MEGIRKKSLSTQNRSCGEAYPESNTHILVGTSGHSKGWQTLG